MASAAARLAAGGQFATGSMGGYYSPAEILAFVDSLRQLDSHGILSDTSVVGLTLQGEPIWSVKISGGAVGQERPEVFYNSLTHSREGMSLMTLLYYMRFLVENYGQVDSVTDLVDSRDLYFIPLVNPDGYEINWQYYLNQKSFGLWRKNARDNNGDSKLDAYDGVDINRNFGFKWGFDDTGSSMIGIYDNYRGTQAFSEPETQAIRDYLRSRTFVTAINLHSYSNVLINPFNYIDLNTPDSTLYRRLGKALTRENGYKFGTAKQTLNYPADGELTDWMYADTSGRGKIIAWTLEICSLSEGFWPLATRITPIAQVNLPLLMSLARLSGFWPDIEYLYQKRKASAPGSYRIGLRLRNAGLKTSSQSVTVRLESSAEGFAKLGEVEVTAALEAGANPPAKSVELNYEIANGASGLPAAIVLYADGRRVRSIGISLPYTGSLAYDVDGNGKLDIFDLLTLLQAIAGHYSVVQANVVFDLNLDGRIDIFDLLALLKALAST